MPHTEYTHIFRSHTVHNRPGDVGTCKEYVDLCPRYRALFRLDPSLPLLILGMLARRGGGNYHNNNHYSWKEREINGTRIDEIPNKNSKH